jgi:hypothetical protein
MKEIPESKIAKHLWDDDRRIHWNKAEIIYKEENRIIRKMKVGIHQNNRTGHLLTKLRHKFHIAPYITE